jgi:hypothetical protein
VIIFAHDSDFCPFIPVLDVEVNTLASPGCIECCYPGTIWIFILKSVFDVKVNSYAYLSRTYQVVISSYNLDVVLSYQCRTLKLADFLL